MPLEASGVLTEEGGEKKEKKKGEKWQNGERPPPAQSLGEF